MSPVPLSFTLDEEDGRTIVRFQGEIDENADFSSLRALLSGRVDFDLSGITRVNSCGVREWVNLVRDLPAVTSLELVACSPAIVAQLSTIYNFRGSARVRSLLGPFVCERCGVEDLRLMETRDLAGGAAMPSFTCRRCGGAMAFDDLPERYAFFLHE